MDKHEQIKSILREATMSKKEKINAQLERLLYLENRGVIKYYELAQLNQLRRELAEIEFTESKRKSSNPPSNI